MASICFFVATHGEARNDNHRRLPRAFADAGWNVRVADHDALRLERGSLLQDDTPLLDFERIWPMGLGRRESFLDRMQLLARLPPERFVVSPLALLTLHAKYALPFGPLAQHHPETHASCDPQRLAALVAQGGQWIAKPAAASFGRDVYRLTADDPNLSPVLDALTGHDGSRYCVVQRYVAEIEQGETRVLTAGGRIIASYLRRPTTSHRANLAADGHAEAKTLTQHERTLAQACADWLRTQGIHWAAIDLAYPWIVEFNIANPGGLETLERLTGIDYAGDVARALKGSDPGQARL